MATAKIPATGLTKNQEVKLIKEVYDNFPESSECLRCTGWDYAAFRFEFVDDEGVHHTVTLDRALKGLRLFTHAVRTGKLPGLGLPADFLEDTGTWDAFAFDALNQMAIYGEVIYG